MKKIISLAALLLASTANATVLDFDDINLGNQKTVENKKWTII